MKIPPVDRIVLYHKYRINSLSYPRQCPEYDIKLFTRPNQDVKLINTHQTKTYSPIQTIHHEHQAASELIYAREKMTVY